MASTLIACQWDWCRSTFPSIDALDAHVKHDHIWPMKPLCKTEIALMRRMDRQSLHSSLGDTQSSIVSRGPTTRSKTPVSSQDAEFSAFTQLSSPLQSVSPSKLPVSPAFEGLVRQDGHLGLSAAVEMFERTRRVSYSDSSQEAVAQQLTQEDHMNSQPERRIEDRLGDTELRWPSDDEFAFPRGQNPRCGSLNVPLDRSPPNSSGAEDSSQSQIILQTQAPYSSQTTDWSQ